MKNNFKYSNVTVIPCHVEADNTTTITVTMVLSKIAYKSLEECDKAFEELPISPFHAKAQGKPVLTWRFRNVNAKNKITVKRISHTLVHVDKNCYMFKVKLAPIQVFVVNPIEFKQHAWLLTSNPYAELYFVVSKKDMSPFGPNELVIKDDHRPQKGCNVQ